MVSIEVVVGMARCSQSAVLCSYEWASVPGVWWGSGARVKSPHTFHDTEINYTEFQLCARVKGNQGSDSVHHFVHLSSLY